MKKLTDEQRNQWAIDGYLHVPQVLSPDEVSFLSHQLAEIRHQPGYEPTDLQIGHYGWVEQTADLDPEGFMDRRDLLPYDEAFIKLIDRPPVFDLIVDIMGPYILFSMSQAIVRPSSANFPGYTHTDGGEALRQIRVTESSRPLALKVLYLLTDVMERDSGNFTVFPGSHMRPFPAKGGSVVTPRSPGAAPLMARAGDCVLFPHSLWHGPSRNVSGRARKTLLYNYCQMCVRSYDFETISDVKDRCSARQRRLLGDLGHDFRPGSYFYSPLDQVEVIESE